MRRVFIVAGRSILGVGQIVNLRPIVTGLAAFAPQTKRIANPLQDAILPYTLVRYGAGTTSYISDVP